MNSRERLLAALRREPVDRVPANITYYMPRFYEQHFSSKPGEDRAEAHLASQTRFGFDPFVGLAGANGRPWTLNEPGRWEVHEETSTPGHSFTTYVVETLAGRLSTSYSMEPGRSGWQMDGLVKQESDLDALAYLPTPRMDLERASDIWKRFGDRGLTTVSTNGIWQQACYLRDMGQMAMDPYIRPEWARACLGRIADYLAAQVEALCQSPADALFINESYVGMGLSPKVFNEFVRPYDQRLIDIAKRAGKLVMYHDCGLGNALLESFADMGIDYLEPLNPKTASGDIDPADAKRRIGDRVCLRGGFNHELLSHGTGQEIREEVRNCLEALSPGGGYILCPAGPIGADVSMGNLVAYAEAAADYCGEYGTL